MVTALGSPLGVVIPERLHENVRAFRAAYGSLTGRIYYAHKANRSSALLREVAALDAGVDVASLAELQHALGAGFGPDRIVATGPKNRDFLWLAARTGVTVSADSIPELTDLAALVTARGLPRAPVTVRLSGFPSPISSRRSRFGVPFGDFSQALDLIAEEPLDLTGVAFHLDTVGIAEKAIALEGCLAALDMCRERGLRPRSVDIGGGFGVNYLADATQWDGWTTALGAAVRGRRAPITWDGHGYGLRAENGVLRGTPALYPAHRPVSGAAYLGRLLETEAPQQRRPLGDLLLDNLYDLHIEPGRALLDQCGLVLATVLEVRDEVIRLDANARDVSLEEHGVLMDPVVIGGDPRPCDAYLFGNLCLEADLITRRKVTLPRTPRPGDLLAFVNTAGYLMDFSATEALGQPIARKAAVYLDDGWRWCLDEQYWPTKAEASCDSTP
jgi:diaminopimelate decarboxylase